MNGRQPKIAVIGPSHSGKTCLAVGLYCTSRPDLYIFPPNYADCEYLKACTVELGHLDWPHATLSERADPIEFKFVMDGKSVKVPFCEYPGEMMADDEKFTAFANAYLRNVDGVVLLVNPGAPAFQSGDGQLYEDTVSQYEKVIDFLADPNNNDGLSKPFVALTVTASDRLEGDLKGKLKEFEECKTDIANALKNHKFVWELFEVTITGLLADQDKPSIADPNAISVADPFLWLIQRIRKQPMPWMFWVGMLLLSTLLVVLIWEGFKIANMDRRSQLVHVYTNTLEHGLGTAPPPKELIAASTTLVEFRKMAPQAAETWLKECGAKLEEAFTNRIQREIRDHADAASIERLIGAWDAAFPGSADAHQSAGKEWMEKAHTCKGQAALEAKDLKLLAELAPERVETNAFLTEEFVAGGWTNRYQSAYDIAYDKFLDEVLNNAKDEATGVPRPLSDDDKDKVHRKASEVGKPFDEQAAMEELQRRVNEKLKEWKQEDEDAARACRVWVEQYVSETNRNELLRKYLRPPTTLKSNKYFDEIVRAAVYHQVGQWFEEDVVYFSAACRKTPQSLDPEEFATKFDNFKDNCLNVYQDPHKDETSWVFQFAKFCKEDGKIEERKLSAFPQKLTITNIDCQMTCMGSFPKWYKSTALEVAFVATNMFPSVDKDTTTLKEEDAGQANIIWRGNFSHVDEDAATLKTIWRGNFSREAGLFAPMLLSVRCNDELVFEEKICGDWFGGSSCKRFCRVIELSHWRISFNLICNIDIYGTFESMTPQTLLEKAKKTATQKGP